MVQALSGSDSLPFSHLALPQGTAVYRRAPQHLTHWLPQAARRWAWLRHRQICSVKLTREPRLAFCFGVLFFFFWCGFLGKEMDFEETNYGAEKYGCRINTKAISLIVLYRSI